MTVFVRADVAEYDRVKEWASNVLSSIAPAPELLAVSRFQPGWLQVAVTWRDRGVMLMVKSLHTPETVGRDLSALYGRSIPLIQRRGL